MNILQEIFKDNYEIIQYTLHPRAVEMENIEKMMNCGDPSFGGHATMGFMPGTGRMTPPLAAGPSTPQNTPSCAASTNGVKWSSFLSAMTPCNALNVKRK